MRSRQYGKFAGGRRFLPYTSSSRFSGRFYHEKQKKAAILLSLVLSGFYGTVNAAGSEDQPIYESGQDPYAYNWFKEDTYGKTYEKTGDSLKAIAEGNGKVRAYTAFVEGIQIKLKDVAVSASARGTNGGDTVQAMAVYGVNGSDIKINGGNLEATAEGGGDRQRHMQYVQTAARITRLF